MDIQKIKQLMDVLAASDLGQIELVEGAHWVRLVRRSEAGSGYTSAPNSAHGAVAIPPSASAPVNLLQPESRAGHAPPDTSSDALILSPLFGIFHLTPAPDAPKFVQAGDRVKAGQTLCVVEAMKMFHEVKAVQAGKVAEVIAVAGQEVEAGDPLFRMQAGG